MAIFGSHIALLVLTTVPFGTALEPGSYLFLLQGRVAPVPEAESKKQILDQGKGDQNLLPSLTPSVTRKACEGSDDDPIGCKDMLNTWDDFGSHCKTDQEMYDYCCHTCSKAMEVSGVGDPHMKNILGEEFDVRRLGEVELLRMPRNSTQSNASFRMVATVSESGHFSGDGCAEAPYMTAMRVHGSWLGDKEVNIEMTAAEMMVSVGNRSLPLSWNPQVLGKDVNVLRKNDRHVSLLLGRATIAVTHDHRPNHFFLNMAARKLDTLGFDLGGILGLDDHTLVSERPANCPVVSEMYERGFRMTALLD